MAKGDEKPAEAKPAGEDAERSPDELDEFGQFETLVEKGVPSRVAVAAIALSRAEGEECREKAERLADLVWDWIDMEAEERLPPTRNGRRPAPWRPFSAQQAWREATGGALMSTRPYLAHEQPGNPFALTRAPAPELLERAGASRMAKALRRALQLRDDCSAAKAKLQEAERAVKVAEAQDRQAHARAIARSRSAVLQPAHTEEAERKVGDLRRRHEALVVATEEAANAYYAAGEQEAEKAAEAAREQRERSADELRRAHEMVVAALDNFEDLCCAANASANPTAKRPRPALRSAEVARIRNDKGLAWLGALAGWIEEQRLAAEAEEEPGIKFGWPKPGQLGPPPGSMRVS